MRMISVRSLVVSSIALSFLAYGCESKKDSKPASVVPAASGQATAPDSSKSKVKTDGESELSQAVARAITDLAKSIDLARFEYEYGSQQGHLYFEVYNLDDLDKDGIPKLTPVSLHGSLAKGGYGVFTDTKQDLFRAVVKCMDEACAVVDISLRKKYGRFAGQATLKYFRYNNLNERKAFGHPDDMSEVQSKIAGLFKDYRVGYHYLETLDVVEGLKNFFSMHYVFSGEESMDREVIVAGEVGKDRLVSVKYSEKDHLTLGGDGDLYMADVDYRPELGFVSVGFRTDQGFYGFMMGKSLPGNDGF